MSKVVQVYTFQDVNGVESVVRCNQFLANREPEDIIKVFPHIIVEEDGSLTEAYTVTFLTEL